MAQRSSYQTKQLQQMLSYMASKGSQHVTAADIRQHFQSAGIKLSTATIYRHLGRMLKEGVVARYTIDGNQGYCYEFLGGTHAQHKTSCFHCKCEHCGILIHLACHEIEALSTHLNQSHHFSLDPARTIFYGRCNRCALDHMAPLIGQGCHHG